MKSTMRKIRTEYPVESIQDPPFTTALFGKVRWAWIWLILRLYVGYQWISSGWGKLHNPAWTGSSAGTAITGFVNGALGKTTGAHPDVQSWYAYFLSHVVLTAPRVWSFMISWGEFLVGVALILGIFTGIAAFFGCLMNTNYLLSGSVSINPILLLIGIFLILAWKTAGWWGLDRWMLPLLGTPWRPGYVFHESQVKQQQQAAHPSHP
jgi:thiosulfate dehydrogenase [quinone] large subunit